MLFPGELLGCVPNLTMVRAILGVHSVPGPCACRKRKLGEAKTSRDGLAKVLDPWMQTHSDTLNFMFELKTDCEARGKEHATVRLDLHGQSRQYEECSFLEFELLG